MPVFEFLGQFTLKCMHVDNFEIAHHMLILSQGCSTPLRKEDTEIRHMTRCDPNFNQRMKSHGKVQNMPKCGIHNSIIDLKF